MNFIRMYSLSRMLSPCNSAHQNPLSSCFESRHSIARPSAPSTDEYQLPSLFASGAMDRKTVPTAPLCGTTVCVELVTAFDPSRTKPNPKRAPADYRPLPLPAIHTPTL